MDIIKNKEAMTKKIVKKPKEIQEDFLQKCNACHHEFMMTVDLLNTKIMCPHCNAKFLIVDTRDKEEDGLIGETIKGCVIEKKIGQGGMCAVYKAYHEKSRKTVAIKLLSSIMAKKEVVTKRFLQEAKIGSVLNHPTLVKIYSYGQERGVFYMIMELVEGESLSTILEKHRSLPYRQALSIVKDIAKVLNYMEQHNIIHRDIKPGNIMITKNKKPLLIDLGIAKKILDEFDEDEGLTAPGVAMGTASYMSPEQLRDSASVSFASDIYSLGTVLYHLITGVRPFDGIKFAAIAMSVIKNDLIEAKVYAPEIPDSVNSLIIKSTEKDRKDRHSNAREFLQELQKIALELQAKAKEHIQAQS